MRITRLAVKACLVLGLLVWELGLPTGAAGAPDPQIPSSASDNPASSGNRAFDLSVVGGGHQRVVYASPLRPRGTVVMLPGGAGTIGIERDGQILRGNNFLIRTRDLWLARGYAVLIPDALNSQDLRGLRSSSLYAGVVASFVTFARSQVMGPIFLVGTSQGSIAAMNGAAHIAAGQIAGLVLTESVSRMGGSHETVFDADPGGVRVSVLIVANRNDRCTVAPPGDAPQIAKAMSNAPAVQVLYVSGGVDSARRACGSLTPHGYYGIEPEVVSGIVEWMDTHH